MKTSLESPIENKKIVFIAGPPRSGTTLLQRLIYSRLRDSVTLPETNFIAAIAKNPCCHTKSDPPFCNASLKNFLTKEEREKAVNKISKKISFRLNYTNDPLTNYIKDLLINIATSYSRNSNFRYLIEKTPSSIFLYNEINRLCPEEVYLAIIRDPRDTFVSFHKMLTDRNKASFFLVDLERFCNIWIKGLKVIEDNSHFIRLIKYEDLIVNADGVIDSIFVDVLGEHVSENKNFNVQAIYRRDEKWKNNITKDVFTNSVSQYQNKLPMLAIEYIEHRCRFFMRLNGYQCRPLSINKKIFYQSVSFILISSRLVIKIYRICQCSIIGIVKNVKAVKSS